MGVGAATVGLEVWRTEEEWNTEARQKQQHDLCAFFKVMVVMQSNGFLNKVITVT